MRDTLDYYLGCCGFFVLIGFIALLFIPFNVDTTQNGEHTGYVTAVEQSGFIAKHHKVYFKTDLSTTQEDIYCVNESNPELASKLKEVAKNKERVTIKYQGVIGVGFHICMQTEIKSFESEKK